MLSSLNIFITDSKGDTILAISEPIGAKQPSEALERLLNEPFLISRLISDANTVLDIKREMVVHKQPRYEWNGK